MHWGDMVWGPFNGGDYQKAIQETEKWGQHCGELMNLYRLLHWLQQSRSPFFNIIVNLKRQPKGGDPTNHGTPHWRLTSSFGGGK